MHTELLQTMVFSLSPRSYVNEILLYKINKCPKFKKIGIARKEAAT